MAMYVVICTEACNKFQIYMQLNMLALSISTIICSPVHHKQVCPYLSGAAITMLCKSYYQLYCFDL